MGVPQYASDPSWVTISELGGRQVKRSDVIVKVPQVVGKLCKLMKEFIDKFGKVGDGVIGNKRFCNIQYLSAQPGLGIIDMREDWKGLMRALIVTFDTGPMYLPVWILFCMTFVKWVLYCMVDS